ncbi:hypothetical protein C5B96_08825 [Subtercola sp. Z020]|uniref:helix-turn-helix transcriptional regulator n=1 Tax=Subtercola sp. Z020 TaxID=2080582 RepID=UPI000CE8CE47|nr:response regulator transcription factor [Subtercola sp. Z020]PPF82731.1 hypothetical protein C5B96_08825 [Subtercola sp. Z020]
MKTKRSLVVLDDRAVLVDGIVTVAQYSFPELRVTASAETLARVSAVARPGRAGGPSDEQHVLVVGGSWLGELPTCRPIQAALTSGASVVALVDAHSPCDLYALRASGVSVFVCTSEGMNELLRGIERAFDRQAYLSPDSENLFSKPARIAPRISPRERQIALLYLSENDFTVDDVAGMLRISSQTVRSHLARLRSHFTAAGFSVRNRLELRQALVEIGMLDSAQGAPTAAVHHQPPALQGEPRFRYAGESALHSSKVG